MWHALRPTSAGHSPVWPAPSPQVAAGPVSSRCAVQSLVRTPDPSPRRGPRPAIRPHRTRRAGPGVRHSDPLPAPARPGRLRPGRRAAPPSQMSSIGGELLSRPGTQVQPLTGAPQLPEDLSAKSWIVADAESGDVLAAHNAHWPLAPASTIKMLLADTLLPKFDRDELYRARPEHFADMGPGSSAVGIADYQTYTVEDLWHGVFLASGNDAAYALAALNGGKERTVEEMNERAAELQALDTHVINPDGYDAPGQVSSAYDLTLIARSGMRNPDFREYAATPTAQFPGAGSGTRPRLVRDPVHQPPARRRPGPGPVPRHRRHQERLHLLRRVHVHRRRGARRAGAARHGDGPARRRPPGVPRGGQPARLGLPGRRHGRAGGRTRAAAERTGGADRCAGPAGGRGRRRRSRPAGRTAGPRPRGRLRRRRRVGSGMDRAGWSGGQHRGPGRSRLPLPPAQPAAGRRAPHAAGRAGRVEGPTGPTEPAAPTPPRTAAG